MKLFILLFPLPSFSFAASLTVMSYNVENFFDDVHNGTEYREFDPSKGKWNTEFFTLRMDTIAEVVRKSVAGGPDILLLQEVENENALRALVDHGLAGMGYAWTAFVPKKGLSANLAIVSRVPIETVHSWAVAPWKASGNCRASRRPPVLGSRRSSRGALRDTIRNSSINSAWQESWVGGASRRTRLFPAFLKSTPRCSEAASKRRAGQLPES